MIFNDEIKVVNDSGSRYLDETPMGLRMRM